MRAVAYIHRIDTMKGCDRYRVSANAVMFIASFGSVRRRLCTEFVDTNFEDVYKLAWPARGRVEIVDACCCVLCLGWGILLEEGWRVREDICLSGCFDGGA